MNTKKAWLFLQVITLHTSTQLRFHFTTMSDRGPQHCDYCEQTRTTVEVFSCDQCTDLIGWCCLSDHERQCSGYTRRWKYGKAAHYERNTHTVI